MKIDSPIKQIKNSESDLFKALFEHSTPEIKKLSKILENLLHKHDLVEWLLADIKSLDIKNSQIKLLREKNINTIYDLIMLKPLRVEDYSVITPISNLTEEYRAVKGKIIKIEKKRYISIMIHDSTDFLILNWFNITPFLKKILNSFKLNDEIVCEGKVIKFGNHKIINHPIIKHSKDYKERRNVVYPGVGKLKNKTFKELIKKSIEKAPEQPYDYMPYNIINKNNLMLLNDVIGILHTEGENKSTIKRFKTEEAFFLVLGIELQKRIFSQNKALKINYDNSLVESIKQKLPFELTNAQEKALQDILNDLNHDRPMLRLLQGDVGSGKTIVGLIAACIVSKNNYQSVIMAPTQILASQWFEVTTSIFKDINVSLLVSSTKNKNEIYSSLQSGMTSILIGTHAILEKPVQFKNLGFIIIDEQHRFGVEQRKILFNKGIFPHTLIMSATPIPRTMSMVMYSKSELSTIDKMPKGRIPTKTLLYKKSQRDKAYKLAKEEMDKKHQVYVVYPLIEESEKQKDVDAAKKMYENLKNTYFKGHKLALLHGKLKGQEKDKIFEEFKNRKIDCLISTTVIEVGVDSQYATVIIIENAEKFGLSTLHQLRGRVGRGSLESYAIFVSKENSSKVSLLRLKTLCETNDGFKIAELDYELRGGGDIIGTRQHGIPDLTYLDLLEDKKMIFDIKNDIKRLIELHYPFSKTTMEMLEYKWKRKFSYMNVG